MSEESITEDQAVDPGVADAVTQLRVIEQTLGDIYNIVDMSDSVTFDREDGTSSQDGVVFPPAVAYSQAMIRPSATACAYINEIQLRMLRARSRAFAIASPSWMAVRESRISYAIGTGHVYSIVPRYHGDTLEEALKKKVITELDQFIKINRYRQRQGEKITRLDRDGEYILRYFDTRDDGILRVRFVEPLLIQTPPGAGPEGDVWFGIQFDKQDYEEPVGYYIRPTNYDGGELDGQQTALWRTMIPAIDIQHRKANVDMSSPRGLPTTYCLQQRLEQALSTLKSMGKLVDFRARIALIRKQVNATLGTIQPLLNRNRAGQAGGPGGPLLNVYKYPYGTIIDTNDQRNYELPAQNIETDKIVKSYQADLASVAAAMGLADFVLSADSGSSFANALVKEGPMDKGIGRLQTDLIEDDVEVYERALQVAADNGRLPDDVVEKVRIEVTPPGTIGRNRIQDAQADEILVRQGAMSRKTMAMRANLDFEDESGQIKREGPPPAAEQGNAGTGDTRSHQAPVRGKATARGVPAGNEPGPGANIQRAEEGLLESSHDPRRSKDGPTQEDVAMASELLTPEWLAKTKAEILALPKTVLPIDPATAQEYEPGVKGIYLGMVDGQQVWACDFDAMMVKYAMPDLVCAGNHMRWAAIPTDKIVVDWSYSAVDKAHDLCHEVCETRLMAVGKWAYGRAHKMSNVIEQDWLLDLRPELRALKPE